jgi:hypothetical protein
MDTRVKPAYDEFLADEIRSGRPLVSGIYPEGLRRPRLSGLQGRYESGESGH